MASCRSAARSPAFWPATTRAAMSGCLRPKERRFCATCARRWSWTTRKRRRCIGARCLGTERLIQFVLHRVERSTRWVLFRRSERTLWLAVERRVGDFMQALEADGAFAGRGGAAWFVRCNSSTNTAAQQGRPSVGLIIGFRPAGETEMLVWSLVQEPAGARISPAAFAGASAAAG